MIIYWNWPKIPIMTKISTGSKNSPIKTNLSPILQRIWINWIPLLLALGFTTVFVWMTWRQYTTFSTRAPDIERFNQAIWNVLNGRFLYATIQSRSILGNHFSPIMALLSPLLLIWEDFRILMLAQTIGLAFSGIFLFLIVKDKFPFIAPLFLLAFYLNPTLHELASIELRRITLAMPFLALAFYGIYKKNRKLMLIGIIFALLSKEDLAIIVFMIGIYLLLFERDWKWGLALTIGGTLWFFGMLLWIIPAFDQTRTEASNLEAYRQLNYFEEWGSSVPEIAKNIISQPQLVLQKMFDEGGLIGLGKLFLPLGFVLPLLAPDIFMIGIPSLIILLLSSHGAMHRLEDWYLAGVIIVLFAAIGIGLTRRTQKQAWILTAVLFFCTLFAFTRYSYAPFGGKYIPEAYTLHDHHQRAEEVASQIPQDAAIAVQSAYTPRLSHREIIYLYPWIESDDIPMDYILLDRYLSSYPLNEIERNDEINNLIADPTIIIDTEVDGIYLFRNWGEPQPSYSIKRTAEDSLHLDRAEVALTDEKGYYRSTTGNPILIQPGQTIRVTLYWNALAIPQGDRTVSIRLADETGWLIAQQDNMPSNGSRPTSWWQPDWQIRDVYYLTIPPETAVSEANLDILLYDSYSQEPIPFANTKDGIIHLSPVIITDQKP